MQPAPLPLSLDISFSARWWSFISSTREFVATFCDHWHSDPDFSHNVSLAAHELLENAAKYSQDADQVIRCTIRSEGDRLLIRVVNTAAEAQIATLNAEMADLHDGEPLAVYIARMERSTFENCSRLGLARIRFEADAVLSLAVEGRQVTMDARFDLPVPAEASKVEA